MGAEVGAAAITGGSNILGAGANIYMNKKNLDAQREENQKDRDFNASEADKSRVYSTNERIAQQLYNTSERQAAQQYQTGERLATQQYNSPSEQASRLRVAGINPAVYFSGAGGSSQASTPMSSAGASSSVPSAAQASFSGGLNTQIPNMPQLLTGASELINALTNADVGKANIDLINANTKIALESVFTQQQITQAMKLQNQLNEANLPHATKKLIAEVGALNAQIQMTKEQTEKTKLEQRLTKVQTKLAKQQAKLTGFEAVTAGILTKKAGRLFESQIESNLAGAEQSRTGAAKNEAETANTKAITRINNVAATIKEQMSTKEAEALLSEYRAKGQISDADYAEAKRRLNKIRIMTGDAVRSKGHESVADVVRGVDAFTEWLKDKISIINVGK